MAYDERGLYVAALHNTHALELQALQIMERQVERLQNYTEMEDALRNHIEETHGQRERLENALSDLAEAPAKMKEGFLGFVGNMMAFGHTPAQDEILKNAFANQAFENFEIAANRSLLVLAEAANQKNAVTSLRQPLREEEAMASTVAALVEPTTQKYLALTLSGEKADR